MKLLESRGGTSGWDLRVGPTSGSGFWGPAWRSWAGWRRRDRRRGEQAGRAGSSCPAAAAAGGCRCPPALEPSTGCWVQPEGQKDGVSLSGDMEAVVNRQGQLDVLCWPQHNEKRTFSPKVNNIVPHSFYIIYNKMTENCSAKLQPNCIYTISPLLYTTYMVYMSYIQLSPW